MNFFKILIILVFGLFIFGISYADNHGEVVEKVKDVIKDLENNVDDEEVPLNDPFAGNEASSSVNMNIPEDEAQDEMSLYNFKLAGLISGKDHSYISLVNSSGEFVNLTIGQFLGKIKLVDLRITEAIFEKNDASYIIIDFNNQIREANEY
ncbi:pilus assembly protein PilP [Candidatus Pelagibacter sp.]|nr:pilus assembly protein PilP [Candidatus Pelagibacter sp.]